jgi:PilZ domain
MFIEKRRLRRHTLARTAQYHSGLGALPRSCIVIDISDGGARLYSEIDPPEEFSLTLTIEGKEMARECRVVWRLGGELGVAFTDRGGR